MKTIVPARKRVSPYLAGLVALAGSGLLLLVGLGSLFTTLAIRASTEDATAGWAILAVLAWLALLICVLMAGIAAHDALSERHARWLRDQERDK